MLECSFNRLTGFKTCNFLKKRLQHSCFPVNIAKFLRTLILMKICEQLLLQFLLLTVNISSWELVSALNSIRFLQRVLLRVLSGRFLSYLKKRKTSQNSHLLSLVVIRSHSLYQSLSFVVIRCHLLSFVVPLVVIQCHSLSFVVTRCSTRLSFHIG